MTEALRRSVLPGPGESPLPSWPGEQVDIGGTSIFVRRAPSDGEPAVLVHGLGGMSTNWTDLMALLSPRLDSHAVDLPGFGRSQPWPHRRYSLSDHARAVVRYIETQGIGPVHLWGNSMGGAVSLRIAARRPDLVRTLSLVSPALPNLRPGRSDPRLPLLAVPALGGALMKRMRTITPEDRVRAVLELCYHDSSLIHPERLAETTAESVERARKPWADEAFARSLRSIIATFLQPPSRGLWADAARVEAPVLLVWGRRDRVVSVETARRARKHLRDARVLLLDDIGHVAQMEAPLVVAEAFLQMIDSAAEASAERSSGPSSPTSSVPAGGATSGESA